MDFPQFREQFGPRGVLHCWATDKDDPTEQPRWGRVGKQRIEDTGPLTKKRMETCDDKFVATARSRTMREENTKRVVDHYAGDERVRQGDVAGTVRHWW
jgi:arylsulfatase